MLRDQGKEPASEMRAAVLPRGAGQHLLDRGRQAGVPVRDHQTHPGQASRNHRTQEAHPGRSAVEGDDVEADDLPSPPPVHRRGAEPPDQCESAREGRGADHAGAAGEGELNREVFKRAMFYGGVMGSFAVERFGPERLQSLTRDEIDARFQIFRELTHLE